MKVYDDLAVIILAAGKGTRMKSDLAKVLHQVCGKSMVVHVIESAREVAGDNIRVVIGHQAEQVKKEVSQYADVSFAVQKELLGTGDAVKAALPGLGENITHVLVLCGDVPLIRAETLNSLVKGHIESQASVTVLAVDLDSPTGYGRIIKSDDGRLTGIREEADASDEEKEIQKVNTGIYCFNRQLLESAISEIEPDNNQQEYYLTDVIAIAHSNGDEIAEITMDDPNQVIGVNTLQELEKVNRMCLDSGL